MRFASSQAAPLPGRCAWLRRPARETLPRRWCRILRSDPQVGSGRMRVTGCGWRTAVHSAGISIAPSRCRQSDNGDSMIGLAAYVAFLGVSLLVICTPGQDNALTIRNTLLGRRRAGIATAFGVAAGLSMRTVTTSPGVPVASAALWPVVTRDQGPASAR